MLVSSDKLSNDPMNGRLGVMFALAVNEENAAGGQQNLRQLTVPAVSFSAALIFTIESVSPDIHTVTMRGDGAPYKMNVYSGAEVIARAKRSVQYAAGLAERWAVARTGLWAAKLHGA